MILWLFYKLKVKTVFFPQEKNNIELLTLKQNSYIIIILQENCFTEAS